MKVAMLVGTIMVAGLTGQPLDSNVQLWFEGTSTVRGFKCSAKTVNTKIITDAADAASSSIADLVSTASVTIPVAGIDCGNGTMNEHMRKALKSNEAAEILFTLGNYTVSGGNATLNGTLQLAGKENAIQIPATVASEAGGVRVKATKAIDMTQWGVKPPSLMMGTMKVKPTVNITFDVLVKR